MQDQRILDEIRKQVAESNEPSPCIEEIYDALEMEYADRKYEERKDDNLG